MEQKNKIFLIILTALLLGGCGQTVDHKGKTPLVQVGNEFLYQKSAGRYAGRNQGAR